jgi:predicted nucleic acid-binding protein
VILDASVVVKWFVLEDQHDEARALLLVDEPLLAPDLLAMEVANVLWVKVRRGELDAAQATRAIAAVSGRGEPQLQGSIPLLRAAVDLAVRLEQPVYDCLYVALAQERDDVLCTADRGLARIVRQHGVARVLLLGEAARLS